MLKEKIITKISTNKLTFQPGGVSFDVTVINNSDDFATFQVELLADVAKPDSDSNWYKISPEVCTKKPPGDSTKFSVFISTIPRQGFAGLMTLTVRVFSLELPASEESRQVIRLVIPGEGVPAPQLDLANKEFNRFPGERFQIPVSIESFNQRSSKVTLRFLGLDSSWFDYGSIRDLKLAPGAKVKEIFECQIPSQLAQAESKSYPFTIEAIALDAPSVRVDGILNLLPQGYIDFKYKSLINDSIKEDKWWNKFNHYTTEEFSLEFDNQSNLVQSVTVNINGAHIIQQKPEQLADIKLEPAPTEKKSWEFPARLKFWSSWNSKDNSRNLPHAELSPETANLHLNGLTKLKLKIGQLRPVFGLASYKVLEVKAVTKDSRVEVRNDTQNIELKFLPVIPLWLQLSGACMAILTGFIIAQQLLKQHHIATVNSVKLNGIATEVFSGSNDQTIRRWQVTPSGLRSLGVFQNTDKAVRVISYRPLNNDRIAVGYENGEIQVFDILSGKSSLPFTDIGQKDDRVFDLAFTKDSRSLFSGHGSGIVWQWNTEEYVPLNRRIKRQIQAGFAVNSLALVGKKESHLAIAGRFNQLKIWDFNTDRLLEVNKNLGGKEDYILSLATITNRPDFLVSSNNRGTIQIWDLDKCLTSSQECNLLDEWNIGNQAVHSVALSNDACYLAGVGDDGKARLWSLDSTGKRSNNQDKAGKIIRDSSKPLKSVDVVRIGDKVLVTTGGNDHQVKINRIVQKRFDCK